MPETPEQLHARAAEALRTPKVQEWDTWPFEGEVRPRALAPLTPEPAIQGQGGVDCRACQTPDSEYLWADERWRLTALPEPHGLPVVVILEPREHFAGPADLHEDLAREQGVMLGRVERAVLAVGGIARVAHRALGGGRRAPALVVHRSPRGLRPAPQLLRGGLGRGPVADSGRDLAGQPRPRGRGAGGDVAAHAERRR
jgi:hypothetical protein